MTCSFLDFLKAGLHSPKMGLIKKSLLWILCQHCCHFVKKNILILGFESVYGILNLSRATLELIWLLNWLFHFLFFSQCGMIYIIIKFYCNQHKKVYTYSYFVVLMLNFLKKYIFLNRIQLSNFVWI